MKKVAWGQDFSGVKPRERERGGGGVSQVEVS